ncbi:hypothetical protein KTQ74_32425 [Pseudomonas chlororaphis]|uniref:hypothetical protein n=1 Tax=Pseudomonas chlororaphis TaxID=587753 RepID=UPI001E3B5787|nr:hypothetical protein [Pseudomonas chlororaphis]MCB2256630.1 hypothetical protein [Pseudomonas chlororaphis]
MSAVTEQDFYEIGQEVGRLANALSIIVQALKAQPGFDGELFNSVIRHAINELDEEDGTTKVVLETVL